MINTILVAIVAIQHILFLILEMFGWTQPWGMKVFGTTPEFAKQTAVLAANQGLYNGFLAAGLVWSFLQPQWEFALQLRWFFLICVFVAGIYGAYSSSPKIFFIQSLPALCAMVAIKFNI